MTAAVVMGVDVNKLCKEKRCEEVTGPDGTTIWATDAAGNIKMKAFDDDKKPINLVRLLEANPDWRSPMGGWQGGVGQLTPLGDYPPGSLFDKLAEAWAGPHDTFNRPTWYGPDGNIRPGMTKGQEIAGEVTNYANVVLVTPFALSTLLPPEVWNAIWIGIKVVKP